MNNELKKRIIFDLCITTGTVVPTALGLTFFLLSFVFGGVFGFLGFLGVAIGFGVLLMHILYNYKGISQNAIKEWHSAEEKKKKWVLDKLDRRLVATEDPRDEQHLRNLRQIYRSFSEDINNGKISEHVPPDMLSQIDQIYDTCILQLEHSYEMHQMAKKLHGNVKDGLLRQRDDIIDEVGSSITELANTTNEVRALKLKTGKSELESLRNRLNNSLEVALATDERIRSFGQDEGDFSDYE